MKKHKIQVRILGEGVREIERVLIAEQIGNFNPLFCTYRGKKYLVHSTGGDISDPFRRDESYLKTLYIEVPRDEQKEKSRTVSVQHTPTEDSQGDPENV